MPRNVEIKALLRDPARTRALAQAIADREPVVLSQRDVFFPCAAGRLKLRHLGPTKGQLIFYQRADDAGPKTSTYRIAETDSPADLEAVLAAAHGVRAVVSKTRTLLMAGRTRIHLDEVEGLGDFLELEVVLEEGESEAAGIAEAEALLQRLGIAEGDLIDRAYVDLLPMRFSPSTASC